MRIALDRRTAGLSVLFAIVVMWAVLEAALMPPPLFDLSHGLFVLLLMLLGGSAGAALIWSWRTQPHIQSQLARRELIDAVELAAVMILDDENIIRHWSRGCEQLYGWDATRAIGRKREELLNTQGPVSIAEVWEQLRTERRLHVEVVERHRDGRELVIHDHAKLFDHGGGRASAVIAVTDVTEWRHAEAALRLSEARLATAVSVQGIFIYEIDLISGQTIWTTRNQAFFGRPVDSEDLGASPEAIEAEHHRQIRRVIESLKLSGEDRSHFDFTFHYPDGSERLAEGWARVIRDDKGLPVRMLGTHLDVTERRQREQALRAGEAERRAILATVPDAMFVCTERGIVRACSATACKLFGYEQDDLVGRNMLDLFQDGRGRAALRRDLLAAVNHGPDLPWPLPINVLRSDGELVPTSFVIGDAVVEGTRMYVICGRDMRPTIATEERFHRLSNDLAQVSRLGMMGEMAGALAHELSQPLSAIVNFLGAANLMLEAATPTDSERLHNALLRASEQSKRAGEIIRRLRAFILRGEADMRAEKLTNMIREAAALVLFNTSSFGVRLSYDFESEDRLVLGDRIQIQQVLVNLIRNAADAMATQGGERRELLITTMMTKDNVIEIAVRDSGPGIAPEVLQRLFSPFATTKREGLGFGLAISRRIVEAHGGQMSAAAAPDGGALFRFTLPVMEEEASR